MFPPFFWRASKKAHTTARAGKNYLKGKTFYAESSTLSSLMNAIIEMETAWNLLMILYGEFGERRSFDELLNNVPAVELQVAG